jgi:hypothetical protein
MRLLASIALILLLPLSLGCGREQADETGGVDTTQSISAVPEPAMTDTATTAADFGFDQRQELSATARWLTSEPPADRWIGAWGGWTPPPAPTGSRSRKA